MQDALEHHEGSCDNDKVCQVFNILFFGILIFQGK